MCIIIITTVIFFLLVNVITRKKTVTSNLRPEKRRKRKGHTWLTCRLFFSHSTSPSRVKEKNCIIFLGLLFSTHTPPLHIYYYFSHPSTRWFRTKILTKKPLHKNVNKKGNQTNKTKTNSADVYKNLYKPSIFCRNAAASLFFFKETCLQRSLSDMRKM